MQNNIQNIYDKSHDTLYTKQKGYTMNYQGRREKRKKYAYFDPANKQIENIQVPCC